MEPDHNIEELEQKVQELREKDCKRCLNNCSALEYAQKQLKEAKDSEQRTVSEDHA
jgi:hypothetical protein